MVIYEVNVAVDRDTAAAYLDWLGPHVDAILQLPGFEGAWIARDTTPAADGEVPSARVTFVVHYRLRDRAALDAYLAEHAARMRADAEARFAGRFKAHRRFLEIEGTASPA